MNILFSLVRRNCKIFFKDKGIVLPSLLAPLILLFLFIAFLGNVYRDSIRSVASGFPLSDGAVESIASGWLLSSLLAVCAVTIAFTAATIMVQDKALGQANDLFVTPAPAPLIALAYFLSTFLVTFGVCLIAFAAGLIYVAAAGWHLTAEDLALSLSDLILLVLFGTALASIVCRFVRSQGGMTGIQATVSAAYGFLCGAYMPVGELTEWLRNAIMLLPGTYGTGLLHSHLMGSAIGALAEDGVPPALLSGMREGFDCDLFFFGNAVPEWTSYLVLALAALLLIAVYVLLCIPRKRRR